jgi:hypothetical protein
MSKQYGEIAPEAKHARQRTGRKNSKAKQYKNAKGRVRKC